MTASANHNPITLAITGAGGRMGRQLITFAGDQPGQFKVVAATDRTDAPCLGQDAGRLAGTGEIGVRVTAAIEVTPQVVIDFSAPAATRALVPWCVSNKVAMVIGTTGLTADDQRMIDRAAESIAVLQATNTSLGVTLMLKLVAEAARQLGETYDIEIVEAHHNQKKDAPSGTAMSLAEAICQATGKDPAKDLDFGRHGHEAKRVPGSIGMQAVRMGDVVGEHTVYFATAGERVEIRHVASTRDTFVHGARRAAAFVAQARAGRYRMADVLGVE